MTSIEQTASSLSHLPSNVKSLLPVEPRSPRINDFPNALAKSMTNYNAANATKLSIFTNEDGSAQINFPGGGSHRVTGGKFGPVKALQDAYKYRLNSDGLESSARSAMNSEKAYLNSNESNRNFYSTEQQARPVATADENRGEQKTKDYNNKLEVVSNQDGTAQINFLGGGFHHVSGGIFGPIQALKDAYGSRIDSISYAVPADNSSTAAVTKTATAVPKSDEKDLHAEEFLPSLKILVDRNIASLKDKLVDEDKDKLKVL